VLLILKAIIIGIVEGFTEFLPVSSTGHMIIVGDLINFNDDFANLFKIVIQLGAILAVVFLYWDKIWNSLKNLMPGKWGFKLWFNIIVAFIPSAVLGFFFDDYIEQRLFGTITVVLALIAGGVLMIIIENKYRKRKGISNIANISVGQAFFIGCFQCLALWPGMSRSASTIMGGWISGLSSVAAAEFSFFLAIPTMIVATGYTLIKKGVDVIQTSNQVIALGVGFLVSFIVAYIVIEKFIGFLNKRPMRIFAIYRIFIGIVLLLLAVFKIINVTI
jgi:undecaprenyl-diphosphatase